MVTGNKFKWKGATHATLHIGTPDCAIRSSAVEVLRFPPISPPAVKVKLVDEAALISGTIYFGANNGMDSIITRIKKKKYFPIYFVRNGKNFKLLGNDFLLFVLVTCRSLIFLPFYQVIWQ